MIIAYRIEYKDEKGPFRCEEGGIFEDKYPWFQKIIDKHLSFFPTPYEEGMGCLHRSLKCAYKSKEDLLYWIGQKNILKLKELGFSFWKLYLKNEAVSVGKQQIVFTPIGVKKKIEITKRLINYKPQNHVQPRSN